MSDEHPVLGRSARAADRSVTTGPLVTDVYDVWEPPADPQGVTVALVHGGFWRAAYDRHHLEPLAAALADDGFHVANLEYARVGMPSGGWPGTGTSLRAQVEALRADDRLPPRVIAVGHSAGGHLVLWLASRPTAPENLLGVVALAPAADLREVHRLGLSGGAAAELLGCAADSDPEGDPGLWDSADPARQRLCRPARLLIGGRDDLVPASVPAAYLRSRAAGEPVAAIDIADADHFDVIDPEHASYRTLRALLNELSGG
ncbi:MAG: alpha/beta hydrolase [Tetrasphaera sp.]|nr:alpha/beta hydrolase [Tetrasphaera sp.]